MATYELKYFDARGVAEVIRFMFAVSKKEFKDTRFKFTFGVPGDFSTIQRPEFDEAKKAGDFDAALGKLPLLLVDGGECKIAQSKAIERFLAREFGLAGSTAREAAQIDALTEHIIDFKKQYTDAKAKANQVADKEEKGKVMEAEMKKFFEETLPANLQLVEKSLPSAPGPWLAGSSLSHADLVFFQFLAAPKGFFDNAEGAKAAFQDCPRIKKAMAAVAENAELQAWIANRPDSMF